MNVVGNINIINILFTLVMTASVPYAAKIGTRLYVTKKFSMSNVARILQLNSPRGSTFSLADLQTTSNNSKILCLYYYWLWFTEKVTQIFLFGTLCLLFFGFLPIILGEIFYTKTETIVLIGIEIGITIFTWLLRYICEDLALSIGVDLKEIW
ncbi:membrane protein [Candidatus Desulfofervidus auxilii]|uniref:Membrane protein n=1 Tax=Desulfofervidus auxilii TaxID=1621989 RepID=A0A7U4TGJ0_DESA2|nr:hypothetical protein [Candidatus Desulfofervidus auxilii]AMM40739.1 membrane protein [Candidatus Desulfofervidus auxilii]CAD7774292.1 hypothetical protein BLFGPEAP_01088 [Candidatus Methanoperedenaceae archaeon GB50]CAD7775604.1 hypothetical protein DMNBHIDG_01154 [Candidatus Methanoperedenaceae archaeon GB37]